MIDVKNVKKSYGPIEALRGISFDVAAGEIVGLLGPNGAGKTTTIKILTGSLQPDDGTVNVNGRDVLEHKREVQAEIGYLPETAPLYRELTVQAYLKMMAELRGIPEEERRARISEAVYSTGLADHLVRPIGELSKGFRQRVGLAQAILHKPRLLILDEPTIGLDPTQVLEVRHLIRRLAERSTVLLSTHILSEVEALCDRVIILINGRIRADAELSELASTSDAILVLNHETAGVDRALSSLPDVKGVELVTEGETDQRAEHQKRPGLRPQAVSGFPTYRVLGKDGSADLCPTIYDVARQEDWPVRELRQDVRTLESVFNELATSS